QLGDPRFQLFLVLGYAQLVQCALRLPEELLASALEVLSSLLHEVEQLLVPRLFGHRLLLWRQRRAAYAASASAHTCLKGTPGAGVTLLLPGRGAPAPAPPPPHLAPPRAVGRPPLHPRAFEHGALHRPGAAPERRRLAEQPAPGPPPLPRLDQGGEHVAGTAL